MTTWSAQHNGKFPDPYSKLKLDHEKNKEKKKKKKKDKHNPMDEMEKSEGGGFVLKHSHQHHEQSVKTVRKQTLGKLPGLVVNVEDSQSEPWSLDVSSIPGFA